MFPLLMLVGFTACNREIDNPDTPDGPVVPEVPALQFTDVSLTLDAGMEGDETSPDTKSVVNIAVEDIFNGAALFAFSHATGNILTYDDGTPVICTTASKSFSWQLPMYDSGNPNSELDIYTLVNYSGNLPTVEAMLTNPSLTKADLDALTFTCGSSSALQALYTSSYGLPMEATNTGVRLTPGNNTLSISAKRLFAKYQFYYDTSDFTSNGYTVNGLYVYACKSNTVVPVFTEGYGQTNLSYVQTVDFGTASDLTNLQYGDSAHAITLYFLENCQGTKSGCSHFWEVASSGLSGLNLCSYIDVGVKVTDPSGNDMNFFYWIYLGSGSGACVTDFNVSRNYSKTLKLMLRRPSTPGFNPPVKSLTFVDAYSTVAANYPSTGSLYFETNMGQAELTASVATNSGNNADASAVVTTYNAYNAHNATGLPYSGIITVTPNADKTMLATVTAGLFQGSSWVASDERTVSFTGSGPTITYRMYDIVFSDNPIGIGGTATAIARKQKFSNGSPTGELSTASVTTWTSNDFSVASINGSGVISGVSAGNATFTATDTSCESGYQSVTSDSFTVSPSDYITISPYQFYWDADEGGSGYAQEIDVDTNMDSSGFSVWSVDESNCSDSDVSYSFNSSTNKLTVYWNSDNTSSSTRSIKIYVGYPSAEKDYAIVYQSGASAVDEFDYYEYENLSVTVSVSPSNNVSSAANNYTVTVSQATATRYEYWTLSGKKTGTATTVYGTPDVWTTGDSAFTDIDETFYGKRAGSVGANSSASSRSATYHASYQFAPGYVASDYDTITQAGHTATVTWRLEPSSLSFSPSSITVGGNATCTTSLIKRKYEDNVATSVTDTPSLSWDTDDSSVATVSNGTVTGTGAGSATITATDSSCESGYDSASGSITVTPADEFEWITTDITIDADGGSETATYRSSSASTSFYGDGLEIVPVSWNSGTGYGTVTISATGAYSAGDTERSVTGSCGSASDVLTVTVHKDVITFAVEINVSGSGRWSHHENVSMGARLARYVNGSFDGYEDTGYTSWSWSTDYYSDFTTTDGVSGWYGYATSTYASTYSGVLHDTSSRVEASITYQGNTYSGYTYVNFTKTYHISCSVEKQSSYGYTSVRAVLNFASPGSVIVNVYSSALGYTLEFSIPAGRTTSAYDYSLTQAQFDSLSTPYMSSSLPNGYYDDDEKAFYYFD